MTPRDRASRARSRKVRLLLERIRASRAAAIARRVIDLFPFTPLGLVTIGCSYAALRYVGIKRVDLLYLVIGAVGLGIAAISLLFTVLVAVGLAFGLHRAKRRAAAATEATTAQGVLRLECGARTVTGFSLPSLWYIPLVRADWSWAAPEAVVSVNRERGRQLEVVIPARRGFEEEIVRRVEIVDAFALTRIAFPYREKRIVRAIPSIGALERLRLARSISSGDELESPDGAPDGERVDLRAYAPGDPVRFILWKVFAKTRELVVRTPERAISPARRAFAYVVGGPGDEAAAGVARKAIESGALGASFVVGADGVAEDARSVDAALELLARSGSAKGPGARDGVGLGPFLKRASPAPATRAIVFAPAFDGGWREALFSAVKSRGRAPLHVVLCTDGLDRRPARSLLSRLVATEREPTPKPKMREVEALVTALARAGAEVTLVDRARGHAYAGSHVLAAAVAEPRRESPKASADALVARAAHRAEAAPSGEKTA